MQRPIRNLAQTILCIAGVVSLGQPGAAQGTQGPTYFFQTTFDSFYVTERGGPAPARGPAISVRPVAGMTGSFADDMRLTVLGGAAASRYARTPESNTDSAFAMTTVSKTIAEHRIAASLLAARSYDPTFQGGVASLLDTALSISRTFTPAAADGWSITPLLKLTHRDANLPSARRWDASAWIELIRPALGGTVTLGGGYNWIDYLEGGRHDDRLGVSAIWLVDLNANMKVGLRSEASFARSNQPGLSVNSFEIGPTLKVSFTH